MTEYLNAVQGPDTIYIYRGCADWTDWKFYARGQRLAGNSPSGADMALSPDLTVYAVLPLIGTLTIRGIEIDHIRLPQQRLVLYFSDGREA